MTEELKDNASVMTVGDGDEVRKLVSLAQKKECKAFETLVNLHQSRVYSLALRMMKNAEEAEELVQETFLSAWQNLGKFRGDSAFGSWLYRICANFALMRLRRRRLEPEPMDFQNLPEPKFDGNGTLMGVNSHEWSRNPEGLALDKELRRAIEEATARLPDDYRAVFLLRDQDGLSYEEIAKSLEITVPAVKSRLHRARLALRESINAFYGSSSKLYPRRGISRG